MCLLLFSINKTILYKSFNFSEELNENDRIITLSTCTDDNKGRRVVHAKLIG